MGNAAHVMHMYVYTCYPSSSCMCAHVCVDMHVVYVFTQTGVQSAPSGLTVTLLWHGSTQPQTRSHMMIVRVGRDPHCACVHSCSVSDLCFGGTWRSRQRCNYPDQTRNNNGNVNRTNDHRCNEGTTRLVTNDHCSFAIHEDCVWYLVCPYLAYPSNLLQVQTCTMRERSSCSVVACRTESDM